MLAFTALAAEQTRTFCVMSACGGQADEIARPERATDVEILRLLFSSPSSWSIAELASELGDGDAEDGVARLVGAGLAHRRELVFPTPRGPSHGRTVRALLSAMCGLAGS